MSWLRMCLSLTTAFDSIHSETTSSTWSLALCPALTASAALCRAANVAYMDKAIELAPGAALADGSWHMYVVTNKDLGCWSLPKLLALTDVRCRQLLRCRALPRAAVETEREGESEEKIGERGAVGAGQRRARREQG